MSKTIVNFWLDVCLLLTFVLLGAVSAILQFVFPTGTSASGWRLWGFDYVAWRDLQFIILCAFAAEVLLHVMLHWDWVCGVLTTKLLKRKTKTEEGIRTIWGVATLIVLLHLLGGAVGLAFLTIEAPR
ncbi:MAG: DUF4405 domain-containing protein [Planctomycetaceae bacterium]